MTKNIITRKECDYSEHQKPLTDNEKYIKRNNFFFLPWLGLVEEHLSNGPVKSELDLSMSDPVCCYIVNIS